MRKREGGRRENRSWRSVVKMIFSVKEEDYKLTKEIGKGASATVYKAIYLPLEKVVAVKCLDLERCNSNLEDIQREAQTMSLIDHPNLISAYCSFVVKHYLWVVMPFMTEGSCSHLMQIAYTEGFEEPIICSILKETLKALVYLHGEGHIHLDVKAGNILLDNSGTVKLGDFGVSAFMFDHGDRQRSRNSFVGTPCWMAPEILNRVNGYDFKADIWSFGITALELAHGHAPFSKEPLMKVLMRTLENAPPGLDYDRDKRFSKSFKHMVTSCLVKDPTKRPTAQKLLKHSFFKGEKHPEITVKKLLAGLVDRIQDDDDSQLSLRRMASIELEALSKNEYDQGISVWNFNVEDLNNHSSLVIHEDQEGHDESIEEDRNLKNWQ
ncbi:Kinase [Zostera marina]|uniref:Kinase n=1 Tax=Zostera marina TaxID=29655 RepID=A0A0K9Q216_ZOSMR|nr:Kinase [Zostera marina]